MPWRPDRDEADDEAKQGSHQGCCQERKLRGEWGQRDRQERQRNFADLQQMGRDVSRKAEEHRVTKGQKTHIADQQIEG